MIVDHNNFLVVGPELDAILGTDVIWVAQAVDIGVKIVERMLSVP